jgi:hypothetical protein
VKVVERYADVVNEVCSSNLAPITPERVHAGDLLVPAAIAEGANASLGHVLKCFIKATPGVRHSVESTPQSAAHAVRCELCLESKVRGTPATVQ